MDSIDPSAQPEALSLENTREELRRIAFALLGTGARGREDRRAWRLAIRERDSAAPLLDVSLADATRPPELLLDSALTASVLARADAVIAEMRLLVSDVRQKRAIAAERAERVRRTMKKMAQLKQLAEV